MSLAAAAVLAATAVASTPGSFALPDLRGANVPAETLAFYTDHFAQRLIARGVSVITARQIAEVIGMERQKELMGCADDQASCLAELANALGADAIITGAIGRFGTVVQLNVTVISSRDGKAIATHAARAGSDEAALDELSRAADAIADQLGAAGLVQVRQEAASPVARIGGGALAAVGLATMLVGGNYLLLRSTARQTQLAASDPNRGVYAESITRYTTRGSVALGAGAVALGAGIWLLLRDPGQQTGAVSATLVPSANGVSFVVSGSFQ